ncbi:MAG TPA: hypothetical protein VFQ53_13225 [Kofleriaceae bacterium]|nr:hypothetical protein [Kofleriaceae bacterium]
MGIARAAYADPERPITEVDVYRDMARFWELAGMDESVHVRGGGGFAPGRHDGEGLATFEVAYRSQLRGWRELLPNTVASGVWARSDGTALVPISIGWQLELGLFSAPYVVANAVATWAPATSDLAAGLELGVGYEWRASVRWAVAADVRAVALWPVTNDVMDGGSPWGARATVSLRRYLGKLP